MFCLYSSVPVFHVQSSSLPELQFSNAPCSGVPVSQYPGPLCSGVLFFGVPVLQCFSVLLYCPGIPVFLVPVFVCILVFQYSMFCLPEFYFSNAPCAGASVTYCSCVLVLCVLAFRFQCASQYFSVPTLYCSAIPVF